MGQKTHIMDLISLSLAGSPGVICAFISIASNLDYMQAENVLQATHMGRQMAARSQSVCINSALLKSKAPNSV